MRWTGTVLAAALVAAAAWTAPAQAGGLDAMSQQAGELRQWVLRTRDHGKRPFAIVDKRQARMHVFDANGREGGSSTILIGQAVGDGIAENVGKHAQQGHVPFEERTTPAGRFVTEPGRNLKGERIVWVHYDSAFAIHRLRGGAGFRERQQRMASASAADKRASLGCVVVPVDFYLDVVERMLGQGEAVVYVMPESGSARELLDAL